MNRANRPQLFRVPGSSYTSLTFGRVGFPGVLLDFGSVAGFTSDTISPWWANSSGGSELKASANNVSLAPLKSSATITMVVVPDRGGFAGATITYAKNNGANTSYSGGFSVLASDSLKIAINPLNQIEEGAGVIFVYANGFLIASINFQYSPP
jgi:hypothetical protein